MDVLSRTHVTATNEPVRIDVILLVFRGVIICGCIIAQILVVSITAGSLIERQQIILYFSAAYFDIDCHCEASDEKS